MLDQLPRHQRAQRDPEQQQHGLGQDRRQGERPSGDCGNADRDHRAGDQPARQVRPQKEQATGGADDERLDRVEDPGAAGQGRGLADTRVKFTPPYGKSANRAQMRHAIAAMHSAARSAMSARRLKAEADRPRKKPIARSPSRLLPSCIRAGISCVPCPSAPWRRPACEHSREAAVRAGDLVVGLGVCFRRFRLGRVGLGAGAGVCANAVPISRAAARAVTVAREESFVIGHLEMKTEADALRRRC